MQLELDLQTRSFNPSWTYMDDEYYKYHAEISRKYGIKNACWSWDSVDMEADGFTELSLIWDTDEDCNRHEVALEGSRAIDVLIAFDRLIEKTGDYHHCFLEGISNEEPDFGQVWTGS